MLWVDIVDLVDIEGMWVLWTLSTLWTWCGRGASNGQNDSNNEQVYVI